jgi:predicted flap endonuclease-1-like 5' DNA nuclease
MSRPPTILTDPPLDPKTAPDSDAAMIRPQRRCGTCSLFILITGAVAALIWWWLYNMKQEACTQEAYELPPSDPLRHITLDTAPAPADVTPDSPVEAQNPPKPQPLDDLTRIRGIGPKIARLLADADIATFARLAETDLPKLKTILGEMVTRLADPTSWPEQARLAADGDWEAFGALQVRLKAGEA